MVSENVKVPPLQKVFDGEVNGQKFPNVLYRVSAGFRALKKNAKGHH